MTTRRPGYPNDIPVSNIVVMISFFGDPRIKDKYIKRVKEHREAGDFIKRVYWKDGKGTAIGCTIHGHGAAAYETELGLPYSLGRLEEVIY